MAFNTVSIDENNLPKLCDHELYLHSLSDVQVHVLTADGGFPGEGVNMTQNGTLYLTPFRLIFIPHLVTQALFSLSFPFAAMRSAHSTFKAATTVPRMYDTYNDIGDDLRNVQGSGYDLVKASNCKKSKTPLSSPFNRISFSLLPLHNEDVPLLSSYSNFFTSMQRPRPKLGGFMPSNRLRHKSEVTIYLPTHSVCTIHNETIIPINDTPNAEALNDLNKCVTCYHQDFLFSFIRAYDFTHHIILHSGPAKVPEQFCHDVHKYIPQLVSKFNFVDHLQKYPMLQPPTTTVSDHSAVSPHYTHFEDDLIYEQPPDYASINAPLNDTFYSPLIPPPHQYPTISQQQPQQPQQPQHHNGGYNFGQYFPQEQFQTNTSLYYQPPSIQPLLLQPQPKAAPTPTPTPTPTPHQLVPAYPQPQPLLNPYSPLLLAVHLSMHLAQPFELAGFIAHVAKIPPQHMYSEWGSMKPTGPSID